MTLVFLVALCGMGLSVYYFYVEQQVAKNPEYKPVCDINDRFSCIATIKSQYAKLLFVPNSLIGIAYYALIMMLAVTCCPTMVQYLSFTAVIASFALAYLSFIKIKTMCPVCVAIYVVNFILFIVAHW
jgi:uncharacterized membrane protein